MNLAEFLLARIAEDESAPRTAAERLENMRWLDCVACGKPGVIGSLVGDEVATVAHADAEPCLLTYEQGRTVAVPDDLSFGALDSPARTRRALAECEAKRRIVALWQEHNPRFQGIQMAKDGPYSVLRRIVLALALPYAGHPDYDPDWAV
jgi:hypothetical protein